MNHVILTPVQHFHVQRRVDPVSLPHSVQAEIEEHWVAVQETGQSFFRGTTFSVASLEIRDGAAVIQLAPSDYAHYLYTFHQNPPERHALRAIYTSCLLVTSDGRFVVGEMASHTSSPGRLQLPGGNLDAGDVTDEGSLDTFGSIRKEVHEEVGIDVAAEQVSRALTPIAVKTGGSHDFVGLMFRADLELSSHELHSTFVAHKRVLEERGHTPELRALHVVPVDSTGIQTFERNAGPVADYLFDVLRLEQRGKRT